jgi:hypothetical protein
VVHQKDTLVGNKGLESRQIKTTMEPNKTNVELTDEIGAQDTTDKQDVLSSVDTVTESLWSEEILRTRRSTRKQCIPDKLGECNVHDPTLKMVLPMRKNKKIAFGCQQCLDTERNASTKNTESNTAMELPNKAIDDIKVMKCSAKMCPGFSTENVITSCCKCYRMIHEKGECSIICRQGGNNSEDKEERECIDCYSHSLLRKT